MISESVARALNHTAIVPRRNLEIRENRKPINKYLVKLKAQCQTNFGVRRDFSDAERTRWRWLSSSQVQSPKSDVGHPRDVGLETRNLGPSFISDLLWRNTLLCNAEKAWGARGAESTSL